MASTFTIEFRRVVGQFATVTVEAESQEAAEAEAKRLMEEDPFDFEWDSDDFGDPEMVKPEEER